MPADGRWDLIRHLKWLNRLRTEKLEEPSIDLKIILKCILNLIKSGFSL